MALAAVVLSCAFLLLALTPSVPAVLIESTCTIENVRYAVRSEVTAIKEDIAELEAEVVALRQALYNNLTLLQRECQSKQYFGVHRGCAAMSCEEIVKYNPNATNGQYWLKRCCQCEPVSVYCNFDRVLAGSKGWRPIGYLDMTSSTEQCPGSWVLGTRGSTRFCQKSNGSNCESVTYSSQGLPYQKVCGRSIGFSISTPDAFTRFPGTCTSNEACTIDDPYVDGLSVTHGSPRQHIWSFAAAALDTAYCPCADNGRYLPPFVGDNYFCEEGLGNQLWDGIGCDPSEIRCCERDDIPWFCRDIGEPTVDDIEVRLCVDEATSNENVGIQLLELFVK